MAIRQQNKNKNTHKNDTPSRAPKSSLPPKFLEVLNYIAEGKSLLKSCELAKVARSNFYAQLQDDKRLQDKYARSKNVGLEVLAEEILDIADDGRNDIYINENGKLTTDYEVVARSRLRVDSRKWLLAKLLPRKYGDKLELSGDKKQPVTVRILTSKEVEKDDNLK